MHLVTRVLFLILTFSSLSMEARESIRVGVVEYPPHIDFSIPDFDEKAFKYLDNVLGEAYDTVIFEKYPNKRAMLELKNGHIDLLFPLDHSEDDIRYLSKPLFQAVPGLCFLKKNFISILSATHRFKGLIVGVSAGTEVIQVLPDAGAKLKVIEGSDTLNRGIDQLMRERIDAFYHPSPVKLYNFRNALSKRIACSYFHGYSSGVSIGVSPKMSLEQFNKIDDIYTRAMRIKSYQFYYAEKEGHSSQENLAK